MSEAAKTGQIDPGVAAELRRLQAEVDAGNSTAADEIRMLLKPYYDLGHQGDFDYTQIRERLAMTPTERLRHHERVRSSLKEVRSGATLIRSGNYGARQGTS